MKFPPRALFPLICFLILWSFSSFGQDNAIVKKDSPPIQQVKDTAKIKRPATPKPVISDAIKSQTGLDTTLADTTTYPVSKRPADAGLKDPLARFRPDSLQSIYGIASGGYMAAHPTYHATKKGILMVALERTAPKTDWVFYVFAGLLFYLAFLKLIFPKYFGDISRVFFNSALRQKQIREQLIQEVLPSLLLNIFFVLSGGLFGYFLLNYYGLVKKIDNQWVAFGFCVLVLALVYMVKYIFIRFMGWILGRNEEAETYNFVVSLVNKFAGFILLPAGLLLAVSEHMWSKTVLFFCYLILAGLLLYRWARSFQLAHKGLKINQLQFLIFIISFEIIPILVLYKVLFNLFS
ncbi:DUF4271 domain-containing protein [Pollutibacter soli]|uniref:DUF4271 domain-containing protein n=1 Tax=Pollutibacter soli TaxID=3034157 RepID=UPI00301363E1